MAAAASNVELKAADPDPERSLAAALALGARDEGVVVQRDTYFRGSKAGGRLKLREQEPGGAELIAYERPDAAQARESRYRIVPTPDPDALREALDAALGTLAVVDKRRRLLLWEGVRIHLDDVEGLGRYVELEGVAAPGSDLTREGVRVREAAEALAIAPERIEEGSYADLLLARGETDALIAAARAAMAHAYAPYSRFRVGAALRAPDGSVHVGANVENAAYPQGQCAEASAVGALVAAGRMRIAEAAVIADTPELCVPCGGCRQRLREFADLDAPVHLANGAGEHRTVTLGELLPLAFGPEHLPG